MCKSSVPLQKYIFLSKYSQTRVFAASIDDYRSIDVLVPSIPSNIITSLFMITMEAMSIARNMQPEFYYNWINQVNQLRL